MAYSGVSACSDSSAFKFALDTVCLLHFALYLPIIYSLFIYQNLLTFLIFQFLSIVVVAYSYAQPLSALNVFCHDLSFSSYTILSNDISDEQEYELLNTQVKYNSILPLLKNNLFQGHS